jgi:hypothetical protein
MRKVWISLLVIAIAVMVPVGVFAGRVSLPKDLTKFNVRFDSKIPVNSGWVHAGDTLPIYLAEDYKMGGVTIIEAGAKGTAIVKEVVKASRPGKPGKLMVSFLDLSPKGSYQSKDGSNIMLSGEQTIDGGGRKILSWLFIFGLFIKGGQAEIDVARVHEVKVAEKITLESK